MTAPTLPDIAERLRRLLAGDISRREASTWAHQWVAADNPSVEDNVARRALERLGAADARDGDTEFLYHDVDFHFWLGRGRECHRRLVDPAVFRRVEGDGFRRLSWVGLAVRETTK